MVSKLGRVILLEKILWHQKSKALLLKEKDCSTRFFYRLANSHRRTNNFEMSSIDGVACIEVPMIQEHIAIFLNTCLWSKKGGAQSLMG